MGVWVLTTWGVRGSFWEAVLVVCGVSEEGGRGRNYLMDQVHSRLHSNT